MIRTGAEVPGRAWVGGTCTECSVYVAGQGCEVSLSHLMYCLGNPTVLRTCGYLQTPAAQGEYDGAILWG